MEDTNEIRHTRIEKALTRKTTRGGRQPSLPPGMLQDVAVRLRGAALVYAVGYTSATVAGTLIFVYLGNNPFSFTLGHWLAVVFVAISFAVWLTARSGRLHGRTLHDVGLVFGVLGSFGIGLAVTSPPVLVDLERLWGISWVCVWIVAFPLIVPTTPRRASVVALLSAVAGSVAFYFWGAVIDDYPPVPAVAVADVSVPSFICALLATIEARIVYRMGRDLEKARRMGSYELVELLGKGGMGEVWRARHRMLARPAAIKLVRPEFLGDGSQVAQLLKRFEREAQATSALTSPHSIGLYDFGTTDEGTFYYVMEFLDGLDLETLVERFGPVPPERAVRILSQACRSLADAHHHGLIHRDIKPANLYSCRMGLEFDFIKVLDFGLVKHRHAEQNLKLTADAMVTGTPAYLSPEAALDKEIDARADLYSLGCVAFWLLTGKLLFEGDTAMEILMHHARTAPRAPSELSELPIPKELDTVVLWCLEKDPERRPRTAEDLAARLDTVVLDEPWTEARARGWWEKHLPDAYERARSADASLHGA